MATKICEICGKAFEARRSTARYCSGRCRQRAHKGKMRQPVIPKGRPAPIAPASFEDVAAALDDARALSNRFARMSATAPRPLRAGCARIGQAITRAITDEEW